MRAWRRASSKPRIGKTKKKNHYPGRYDCTRSRGRATSSFSLPVSSFERFGEHIVYLAATYFPSSSSREPFLLALRPSPAAPRSSRVARNRSISEIFIAFRARRPANDNRRNHLAGQRDIDRSFLFFSLLGSRASIPVNSATINRRTPSVAKVAR